MAFETPSQLDRPGAMNAGIPPIANPPADLVQLLYPGEVVLWVGSPAPNRYARQMQQMWRWDSSYLSRIAGGALALIFMAPVLLAQGAIMSLPSPFNWVALFVALGAALGLLALIWQLGVGSISTGRAADTIYAITDRRVLESRLGNTRTYLPGELNFLTIRAGSDDLGDVLFRIVSVAVDEGETYDVKHGLIGVEHPREVGAILRAAFPQAPFVDWLRRQETNP